MLLKTLTVAVLSLSVLLGGTSVASATAVNTGNDASTTTEIGARGRPGRSAGQARGHARGHLRRHHRQHQRHHHHHRHHRHHHHQQQQSGTDR